MEEMGWKIRYHHLTGFLHPDRSRQTMHRYSHLHRPLEDLYPLRSAERAKAPREASPYFGVLQPGAPNGVEGRRLRSQGRSHSLGASSSWSLDLGRRHLPPSPAS